MENIKLDKFVAEKDTLAAASKIFYLCNGEKKGCSQSCKQPYGECKHTDDLQSAKNYINVPSKDE